MDINDAISGWGTYEITITRNRAINSLFMKFLEQFPILQLLFHRLGLQ